MNYPVAIGTGFCTMCHETKSVEEFWPNPRLKTGLSSWCKDCHRVGRRRTREKHRDRYNAARRKPKIRKTCELDGCDVEFETGISTKRFCSDRHQRIASRRRAKRIRAA